MTMAMNASSLQGLIISKLEAAGFNTTNEHAKIADLCTAVAEAVVEHIQANAKANITTGSSAGKHSIL